MVSNFYCKEYIFYSTYPSDGRFLGFRSQNISKLFAAFAFAQEIEFKTVWSSTELSLSSHKHTASKPPQNSSAGLPPQT